MTTYFLAAVACLLLIATGAAVALAPLLDVAGAL